MKLMSRDNVFSRPRMSYNLKRSIKMPLVYMI